MGWGIGIDMIEPSRVKQRLTANPGLLDELFTPSEQSYCRDQSDPSQHLAARFCAKEAVVKALGVDGWDPLDLEILAGDPAPRVHLLGDIADRAEALDVDISISLTHVPAMAMAIAIAIPRNQSAPRSPGV